MMKKLSCSKLVVSGNAHSEDFVYNCKFKTSYKNDTGKKLKSTNDKDKYTLKIR